MEIFIEENLHLHTAGQTDDIRPSYVTWVESKNQPGFKTVDLGFLLHVLPDGMTIRSWEMRM